ncbi:helix-turn-helix transcriptional regulator [Salidesulfovibrio onnuriiensis]|uniref:helix-turn-helix transcriptional regulator n=1 Tax=Salidesulfovibrio onnuriiensis TaxID=2583823 RepID=UPI0011C9AC6C|nr:helix-turn-helix transcriptional regulator [Salidesulfovibrio onnuriiensis]
MLSNRRVYREFRPCPALQNLVRCYWTLIGTIAEEERVIRVYPDGCMDLIFDLRGGMLPAHLPDMNTPPSAFFCGIMPEHELIRLPTHPVVAGIRFRPGGASILPAPASEFASLDVPIRDIFPDLAPMVDFLGETEPVPEQLIATVENHLLDRLRLGEKDTRLSLTAATRLSMPGAAPSVAELAHDMGVSQKTLERSFKHTVGLTPKKFARVNRLTHSLRLLTQQPIAHTALDAGYTDQAHFTKEFKQLCGVTPAQFQARPDTVDFLQDEPPSPK